MGYLFNFIVIQSLLQMKKKGVKSKESLAFCRLRIFHSFVGCGNVLILTFAVCAVILRVVNNVHKYVLRLMKSYYTFQAL